MKKKQFMSKLAALTMAAAMGFTALPATVMAAGLTGVAEDTTKAATTGLVQTTLPTELTDDTGAVSQGLLEGLKKAYAEYDHSIEANVEHLDANAVTTQDVTDELSFLASTPIDNTGLSSTYTFASSGDSKYGVILDATSRSNNK